MIRPASKFVVPSRVWDGRFVLKRRKQTFRLKAELRTQKNHTRAFTLLELLVVVGLITILVAGVGFALRDNAGSALTSAQNSIGSLLGQARAQAAVNQTEARLLIYAVRPPTGDAEKYLRLMQVFRAEPQGSTTWVAAGGPVYLPRGTYLVPPTTTGLLASGVVWPVNPAPVSTLSTGTNPGQPAGTPFNGANTVFFLQFNADGTFTPPTQPYVKVAIATAAVANNIPQFNNPGAIRGVLLRPSGAVTFVNDAAGF
ncbi:MAG: prepilin-type N-terminal cleavage/methylation domain-containing protein [Opitutus sp.]|nr:prepilin-type N-terminal cleavage/methylation domain-containing protein [Opitutus sp.]